MRSHFFVISNCNENHLARNAFFSNHESELKAFREKENHSNANVPCNGFFFPLGVYFIFRSDLRRFFLTLKSVKYYRLFCLVSLTVKSDSCRIYSIKSWLPEACNDNKNCHKK